MVPRCGIAVVRVGGGTEGVVNESFGQEFLRLRITRWIHVDSPEIYALAFFLRDGVAPVKVLFTRC